MGSFWETSTTCSEVMADRSSSVVSSPYSCPSSSTVKAKVMPGKSVRSCSTCSSVKSVRRNSSVFTWGRYGRFAVSVSRSNSSGARESSVLSGAKDLPPRDTV